MKRTFGFSLVVLLSLGFPGCDNAKQFAAETREGYKMVEEVSGQVSKMVASLDTNDLAAAKETAAKIERVLSTPLRHSRPPASHTKTDPFSRRSSTSCIRHSGVDEP